MPDAPTDSLASQSRESLLAEVQRLRWLVEAQPQVPWEADAQGNITDFSQRWLDLTGLTREEALGGGWMRVPHPEDLPAMAEAWTRSVATGEPYDVEHRIRLADGSYRWMRSRATARRGADGEILAWYATTEDVHERVLAAERLAEAAEAVPAFIAAFDAELRLVSCNRRFEDWFGRPRADILGRRIVEVVGEANFARLRPYLERALAGERAEYAQWLEYDRTGRRFMRATYVPYFGEDGRVAGFDAHISDDTEARLTEEALRESESQYRQIAEGIPQIVWTTRPDGYHDFFNERWYAYTGMARGEQRGWDWKDFLHPEDYPRTLEAWTRCLATGEPYEIEYRFKRRDGTYRWFLGQALAIRNEEGAVVRWFGTLTDVHDQRQADEAVKRAADALRASEARLRLALETARLGTWDHDVQAGVTHYAEAVGPMFGRPRALLSLSPEELLPYVHPGDRATVAEAIQANLERGEPYDVRIRIVGDDGLVRWVESRGDLERDAEGRPLRVRGVALDVTEQVKAERALREANENLERAVEARTGELTRANRDLDQFAYSVAHDLRAPLRSIVSSSRILLEDAGERLSDEERALLERQAASGLRLAGIVDDLLGFARLAQAEPTREAFDLTGLARATAQHVWGTRGAGCTISVQEGMAASGDPSLIGYVLTNLLDNACKFSPEGGRVTVGEAGGAFYVRDEGVGFDMAHAGKLFVAFERLVGQDAFEGTGVGLANVRRIVEKHGGRVWAESEPGKGATFWFTLG